MLIVRYDIINGIERFRAYVSRLDPRRVGPNASGRNLMLYLTKLNKSLRHANFTQSHKLIG